MDGFLPPAQEAFTVKVGVDFNIFIVAQLNVVPLAVVRGAHLCKEGGEGGMTCR